MISFRLQLTLILAVAFVIFLGGTSSLAFNYFYWIVSKMGGTYKFSSIIYFTTYMYTIAWHNQAPLWLLLAFVRWNVWSHKRRSSNRVGTRFQSSDHFVFRAILSHCLTTLDYNVQQLHVDARYTARFNMYTLLSGRSESCEFRASSF